MPAGTRYCIPEGMLGSHFDEIDYDKDGATDHIAISVFNQFLHPNHPLGWIRKLDVSIDGQPISPSRMAFVLRGQWIALEHMASITDIWWRMHERAQVTIRDLELAPGPHEVTCTFSVSLYMHTPNVDRTDTWPSLHETVTAILQAGAPQE